MDLEKGRVVISKAGHDKNGVFAVIGFENGMALIADGKERKLEKPKMKNPKHLELTKRILSADEIENDKALFSALKGILYKTDNLQKAEARKEN